MQYVFGALLIGALIVIGFLLFQDFQKQTITNYPSKGTEIIAFGDSLVVGAGAKEGSDFVSLVSKKLGVPITNLGQSGDTTESALLRLERIEFRDPKVVIVLLGGNDYLRRVPQETTFENLSRIIEKIQEKGAIVLLLGVRGGVVRDSFEEQFEALRDKYHTAYVSNVLSFINNPEYMNDAVHPNDQGYAEIAERVAPVLKKLLE